MKHHKTMHIVVILLSLLLQVIDVYAVNVDCPDRMVQGEICLITVSGDDTVSSVRGVFAKRNVYLDPTGSPGTFRGIMGVDLGASPETRTLVMTVKRTDGTVETVKHPITIVKGDFSVQRLTLDDKWVSFDEATLKRIRHENEVVSTLYATESPKRLWTGSFIVPLSGPITGEFGLMRYINGNPSSSHTGIDISAVTGTPIVAANDGKVALVMDMFFSGLSVFIDHGQGLYTMYFHLSEVLVTDGQSVIKGQTIALVGATGRVTGAHLHFGVRLNRNKVNPYDLIGESLY